MNSNIETVLSNLEESFQTFQNTQEKRWKNFYEKGGVSSLNSTFLTKHQDQVEFEGFAKTGLHQKAMLASEKPGAYLIPEPVVAMIDQTLTALSPLRSLCSVTSISTDKLDILKEEGEAGVGWVLEKSPRDETSTPNLKRISIPVFELFARPLMSQQLLDDARIDVAHWICERIAEQMAIVENYAFLYGEGHQQPGGILKYEQCEQGTKDKIQVLHTGVDGGIASVDLLVQTLASLPTKFLPGACWVMGRSALAALYLLKETTGRPIWQANLKEGSPSTLLGYPVVLVDDMPPVGMGSDSILFGNFKAGYQIVDRSGITILRDPYTHKPHVEFYATKRVGGGVIEPNALKIIRFGE